MEIQTKEPEYCKLEVHYEGNQEEIDLKKNEVLVAFKNAPVKGFTKQPPMDAIRLRYAKEIDAALKQALCEEAFHNTLFQENVKAFSSPQFSNVMLTRNKFICDFTFNIRPKFTLGQYKDLEIPKQAMNINIDTAVEKAIQNLRIKFGDSKPYTEDEFVVMDDMIIIDYEVFDGDKKLDILSTQGQIVNVGQSTIANFDDNMLGMKVGEVRNFNIKVTEDALPSFAGKELKFVVTLVAGSKLIPCPLTDELARKAGQTTLEELRQQAVGICQAKQQETERNLHLQQILERLLTNTDIKVPDYLSLSEAKYLTSRSNVEWDTLETQDKEHYLKMADKNVKVALILESIREEEPEMQLSDQEVIEIIRNNYKMMKLSDQDIDKAMMEKNKTGELSVLAARLRDEHSCNILIQWSKFVE